MKKNKWIAITLSLILTMMIFTVGCGGNDDEGAGGDGGQVTLELFSNKQESINTLKKMIAKFEENNPNIKIKLNAPPEAETVLKTKLTKNDLPDLMSIAGNATYGEVARAGVLEDFSGNANLDKIQPAYIDMISKLVGEEKEGVYGIPYATNANTVIYNKEKLDKLGVEVPKTWDEFVAVLDKAKANGEVGIYFTLKDAWTGMIPFNSIAANEQGEDFVQARKEGKTTFKERYEPVANKMLKLLEYGHGDNFGVGYGDGNIAFAKGESVFYLQGNWAVPEILKANPDIKLGVFAMPVTNNPDSNRLVSGVDVLYAMNKDTKYKEQAQKFIDFMISQENAKAYIDEQAAFSAIEGVYQENPIMEGIKDNFESGRITFFPDHYYPPGMQVENLVQEFLLNKDKNAFLKTMDSEWEKVQQR